MARKKKTKVMRSMTFDGAATLFKFYKDNFGCELVKDRELDTNGVTWRFEMTWPFKEEGEE